MYGRIVRTALTANEMAAEVAFDIGLKLRNREELEARINRGEILSRAALEAYLPTAGDYARVRAWLVAQGFKVTLESGLRHAIFAQGSYAQVARAFGVQLARVATADGEFTSAVSAPALPDEIAGVVAGIRGLQPHLIRHPLSPQGAFVLVADGYDAITPAAVAAAYQVPDNLFFGGGQTIAVIGDSIPNDNDLAEFWAQLAMAYMGKFDVVNVNGGPGADTTDQFEASMDVEWAAGMAPQANIRFYAVPHPLDPSSEAAVYTQILNDLPSNPTLHQVTESFAGLEADRGEGDSSLLLLAAQGVSCFAASGDGGSNPDPVTGAYNARAARSVCYPASDPSVTAVGGTTLLFPEAGYGNSTPPEVAWSPSTNQGVTLATGGGISGAFVRPSWQVAAGMPAGNQRCVPDVAAMAYFGKDVGDMGPLVIQGGNAYVGGGTSLSSPIWAGICALINQSRQNVNLAPVGFLNPKLYAAAGTSCFTDITSGNNGAYSAGVGYDLCTGLGTPTVANLITYLSTVAGSPWIYTQPANQLGWIGKTAQFTVAIGGYPQPTCQWQVSSDGGLSWSNLSDPTLYSGMTTQTLTVTDVTAALDGYQYRFVATNASGNAVSNAGILTVGTAPVFTTQPMNQSGQVGGMASFSAAVSGTPTLTYQWQLSSDGGLSWTDVFGAETLALTVAVSVQLNGYEYRCVATNGGGSTASAAAMLTVAGIPGFTTPPANQTVQIGTSAYFSVVVSGTAPLTYQWEVSQDSGGSWTHLNDVGDISSGYSTPNLTIFNVTAAMDGYQYRCLVSNSVLSWVPSAAATLTVSMIIPSGSLWGLGDNFAGEIGDGAPYGAASPLQMLPGGVQAFSAGGQFTLIVKTDGSLWATGYNSRGQLGDGTTNTCYSPEQILAGGVQTVAAGGNFSLVLKNGGSLWAMGDNERLQLGGATANYDQVTPQMFLPGGVQAISAGNDFSLILMTDGSLWAMGDDQMGQLGDGRTSYGHGLEQILPGGVQAISAGNDFSLILKTDGSLWAMGDNQSGQLGDGTTTNQVTPKQILPSGVRSISAGYDHSLILKTDGSLWATGGNEYGQVGDGTTTSRNSPEQILPGGVQAIAAGGGFSLVLKTDESLWGMGLNLKGNLGSSWEDLRVTTPELFAVNVQQLSAGADHSLFKIGYNGGPVPTISAQPIGQYVTTGGNSTFTVSASGDPAPSYQWQVSTDRGENWTNPVDLAPYSGTATSTLTITGATATMSGYQYRCLAFNLAGNTTSNAARLTVISDQAFLQQLFLDVLERPIDSGALTAYLAAMSGGRTRAQIYGDLIVSGEYAARQIEPVIRLYHAAFARTPDYLGLQNWSNALRSGTLTLTGAADQFAGSAEFLLKYGSLDNPGYVQQLYRNVLGREADPAGLADWVGRLNGGQSRGAILVGFSESPEFQTDLASQVEIIRLYDLLLQRVPTDPELQNWLGFLKGYDQTDALFAQGHPSGMADSDYVSLVFQGFLRRPADAGALSTFGSALTAGTVTHASLVNTLLTSTEFNMFVAPVSRLYMAAFHRVPDAGGLDNWVAYVRAGNPLQSAADQFVASAEFQLTYGSLNNTQYVTLLYENVLGREPDPTGLATWTGQLASGSTRGQILIGFSESPEGIRLFAPTVRTFLHYFAFLNATPAQSDLDYWKNYLATLDDQMSETMLGSL